MAPAHEHSATRRDVVAYSPCHAEHEKLREHQHADLGIGREGKLFRGLDWHLF